jgi:hypothetical protein
VAGHLRAHALHICVQSAAACIGMPDPDSIGTHDLRRGCAKATPGHQVTRRRVLLQRAGHDLVRAQAC